MPRRETPLTEGDSPLLRLAAGLRKLRHGAGSPSYRALSELAHYSVATLSGAAAGRRLPTLDVTLAYVRACGGDTGEWERRWYQVAAELAAESAPDADSGAAPEQRPPYAGLVAFEAEDCDRFFGRERLVADLTRRVGQRRLIALFGASGAGKTSLLRAGLAPALRAGGHRVIAFSPGPRPLEELAIRLADPVGTPPGRLLREFTASPRNVHLTLRQLATVGGPGPGRGPAAETVLVVDQFEEIFTHCRDEQERTRFLSALLTLARAPKSGGRVVLGVRADFYPHCAEHGELVEALRDGQITVGPMNVDELHSVITRPAALAGCRVEGPLLAHLIAQAQGRAAVLPLLSHALLETWHRRRGNVLTLDGFRAAGGIEGALAQTAESFYASLPADHQDITRQLFQRLTTLGDGTEDTRRRITRAELDPDGATAGVLEHAARARLIVLDGDSVEITHEALIRGWPRLRHWLSENRDLLRISRRLTEAAEVWESLGRDPGALYRGARLALARQLAEADTHRLTAGERAFLDESLAAESTEASAARRRSGRLRLLTGLLALLLLLATGTTYYALRAGKEVTEQRNAAVAVNASDQASALEHKDPALARQVALAAHELAPQRRTRDNLLSTLMGTWRAHGSEVVSLAVVPGGSVLATGSGDQTARLWSLDTSVPRPLSTLRGMHGTVWSLAADPGGRVLATADASGEIRTWSLADARAPAELAAFGPRDGAVRALAYSPDGRILASAGADRTTLLWDVSDPGRPRRLARLGGHVATVRSVAFDRSGRVVATVGDDRELQLWDVRDLRHPREYGQWYAHAITALAAAFSPRADLLATAGGGDDSVRLWSTADPARPRELAVLPGHSDVVGAVAFSPDGGTLATGSDDRTVRLWDVSRPAGRAPRTELTGYTTAVGAVAFAADGHTLFTGVYDGMVRTLPMDFPGVIDRACTAAGPALTEHQWHRYLPGVPFHPPCAQEK